MGPKQQRADDCDDGFEGGRSAKLADIGLHVPASNYGVVEDVHQSMYVFAQ
jgi:hypothetical protein